MALVKTTASYCAWWLNASGINARIKLKSSIKMIGAYVIWSSTGENRPKNLAAGVFRTDATEDETSG